jgi:hypothetical protein
VTEFTIALCIIAAFVAFSAVVLIIRALARDEDAHEEFTSERLKERGEGYE